MLQTASVLGREFPLRLLEAVWSGPSSLEPHLAELRRLEFIHDQGGDGEPVYVFNHALTQDVAYQSLLSSRRRRLHEAAGTAWPDPAPPSATCQRGDRSGAPWCATHNVPLDQARYGDVWTCRLTQREVTP